MIYSQTRLRVVDNTGATVVRGIKILKNSVGSIGSILIVSLVKCKPHKKVKKGQIYKALVIKTKKAIKRKNNTLLRFNQNCVILLKSDHTILGKRIKTSIPYELRKNSGIKFLLISKYLI